MAMVVEAERLRHVYGNRVAIRSLTFRVEEGEVFGLLGPNGAGKSTTVGILTSQIVPTGGRATIQGYDVTTQGRALRSRIGLASTDVRLSAHLTVAETLTFYGLLYGLDRRSLRGRVAHLLSVLDLEDRAGALVKSLSDGLRRRVNLALALVHDPPVIFLDEPTTALDPRSRHGLWKIIRQLKWEGKTILLTTHYMEEAEALCDRIGIVDGGDLVALGTPAELKASLGEGKVVEVEVPPGDDVRATVEAIAPGGQVSWTGGMSIMTEDPQAMVRRLLEGLRVDAGVQLRVREPSLEDVFLRLTGRTIQEDGDTVEVAPEVPGRRHRGLRSRHQRREDHPLAEGPTRPRGLGHLLRHPQAPAPPRS